MGEGARHGLELVGLRARGDAQSVHLAGDHPGSEADAFRAACHVAARRDLDRRSGHGAGGGGERKVLGRVVRRIDPEQRDQVAEALDEIGVEVQTRFSREEVGGKVPLRPQLRNSADESPKRAPGIAIGRAGGPGEEGPDARPPGPPRVGRGPGPAVRLTVPVSVSYIRIMRAETRRNRNPLSIDHAFT